MRTPVWFAAAAALFCLGACAPRTISPGFPNPSRQIPPEEAVEDCFTLLEGESVHYSFQTGDPVNFDLHYHEGSATHYPVRMDRATHDTGTFVAPKRGRYCLSWANSFYAPVGLTFQREIRPRAVP